MNKRKNPNESNGRMKDGDRTLPSSDLDSASVFEIFPRQKLSDFPNQFHFIS